jgi:outer membrane protein OmpA-like peptidoglycan-associated protein
VCLSALIVFTLAACTTLHPQAPHAKPPSRIVSSASGIAMLDPGSYEQDRDRIIRTLANDERDSLAPSEVGYYMDILQGRLKQIPGNDLSVVRQVDRVVVDLTVRAGFEPGNAQLMPAMRELLTPLSKALLEYRKTLLSVRIRPEDAGTQTSNARLAEQRAAAVARCLVDDGVASRHLVVIGTVASHTPAAKAGPEGPVRIQLQIEPIVRAADNRH